MSNKIEFRKIIINVVLVWEVLVVARENVFILSSSTRQRGNKLGQ